MLKQWSTLLCISLFSFSSLFAQNVLTQERLNNIVSSHSEKLQHIGVTLEVQTPQTILHAVSGYANLKTKIPMKAQEVFPIGSASKVFVSVACFQLIEAGKLTLNTKISTFYPKGNIKKLGKYKGKNYWDTVTVGMLLNHTSGFIDYLNVYGDDQKALEVYGKKGLVYSFDDIIKLATDFGDANFKPGTEFRYSNTGYIILGDIIHKVSGQDWRDYVQLHILDVLSLKHTWFGTRLSKTQQAMLPQGYFYTKESEMPFSLASSAGEIVSTVDDLNRFIRAWGKGKFYTKHETLKRQMTEGFHPMYPDYSNITYGYGIMKLGQMYGHGGQTFGFQSYMATDPKRKESYALGMNDAASQAMFLFMSIAGIDLEVNTVNIEKYAMTKRKKEVGKYYEKAYANHTKDEQNSLYKAQVQWKKNLQTCKGDIKCLEHRYDTRISELEIDSGSLTVPKAVLYHCGTNKKDLLTVYFYKEALVPTVVLNHHDTQSIAYIAPSGSGAKYINEDLLFWEHQQEVTLKEKGVTLHCQKIP